ncbi:MAG TPA: glycoside hydrolase family 3 N-terminal domain-containing protein [Thermodesulfovibrionales bacterium]|nr:glycoside hydrolase family 3 N-terminal domain-containing protein [Thermodesulfovibrionales bacterium]
MNPYSRLIPRLNGKEIEQRFDYYLGLAKKGVAGFIVFGGKLETVREGIRKLRAASVTPLIIASDLEQGLGQQVEGGTIFPPAMGVASALRNLPPEKQSALLRRIYTAFALEAKHAGIDVILAPVLDINTNPENPIIATRAFGEDPERVSFFGCEMVKILRENGITACGKHFPGHGDTDMDSHISLPLIRKDLSYLEKSELVPFRKAIEAGVSMIMLGHLSVPALDPSERPATISKEIIGYLKSNLRFKGTVISDAMNMGSLAGYDESEASLMALNAGVDLILHPSDPDKVASYLRNRSWRSEPLKTPIPARGRRETMPDFSEHQKLSYELARMAVTVERAIDFRIINPFLIILKDEEDEKEQSFISELRKRWPNAGHHLLQSGDDMQLPVIPMDCQIIVVVFSQTRAWKGKTAAWLRGAIEGLRTRARVFISLGNPYVFKNLGNVTKIYAYWNAESAQEAVVWKMAGSPD